MLALVLLLAGMSLHWIDATAPRSPTPSIPVQWPSLFHGKSVPRAVSKRQWGALLATLLCGENALQVEIPYKLRSGLETC
jgi:hypothetical protein